MPVSQNQRLRKAAAKAAKRKVVVAEKLARERRDLTISKPRHIDFAASPIVACRLTSVIEAAGIGTLIVARKLSLGRFALSVFLVDLLCLGVKNAYFRVAESEPYQAFMENFQALEETDAIDPARARRLVRDAAAYGADNGFPPPADFVEVERIFGEIAPAGAPFVFGQDGKPHYVAGPRDSLRRSTRIRETLERRFGPDGFHVTLPIDLGEFDGDDDDFDGDDDDFIEGETQEIATIADVASEGAEAA
jgi:hypothetical protein